MKKFIVLFSFVFILFGFSSTVLAKDGSPIITYTLNGISDNITVNPVINPVQVGFVSDENIENWVSVKIEKNDLSVHKYFYPSEVSCDGKAICSESWDGHLSDGTIASNGIYNVIVKIKSETVPTYDVSLTSWYTIIVDTQPTPSPTLSSLSITTPATKLDYNVGEALDISGLIITGTYSDGSTKTETITSDRVTGFDSSVSVANQVLTITVDGVTIIYIVNINDIIQISNPTETTTNIHLTIKNNNTYIYNNDILVSPCDSDNDINTSDIISPYCAILQLPEIKSDWAWYGTGAFVNSINDVVGYTSKDKDGKDVYHYWSWSLNGGYGETGLNQYELKDNDLILLDFVDPVDENPEVITPVITHSSGGGSSISNNKVDVDKALEYLSFKQNSDGSFGSDLYTDWAGIAFASTNENSSAKEKIINYLKVTPLISSVLTDNERHAMALMSLGINPYSGTEINYIQKITDSFDGTQFGDPNLVNDDIFALIVLKNAGYTISDEIITKDINYIISKQSSGSWGNVDMTSAGLQALRGFENIVGVSNVISKAENYLISNQNADLGFGNSFSTSWVLQSMFNNNQIIKAENYLALKQQTDGGLENITGDTNNRIWATSYVIPAVMNKSWGDIMQSFSKPSNKEEVFIKDVFIIPEDKKIVEISKIEENINSEIFQDFSNQIPEISTENNLGASAGNAVSTGVLQIIINFIVNIFAYIGKFFMDLINFIGAVFR